MMPEKRHPPAPSRWKVRDANQLQAIPFILFLTSGTQKLDLRSLHPESWQRIQEFETYRPPAQQVQPMEFPIPYFVSHLNDLNLKEGDLAHFECRVEPSQDPDMTYELLKDGQPLLASNRTAISHDFGYVSLDIAFVYPEDSGIYTCKASNKKGVVVSTASLKVKGKDSIVTTTLHPMGQQGLESIKLLEQTVERETIEELKPEFPKPIFVEPLKPSFNVNEGQGLHMEARVEPSNDPSLEIEWLFNGQPLISGSRFATNSDFGFIVLDIHDLWSDDSGIYTCR